MAGQSYDGARSLSHGAVGLGLEAIRQAPDQREHVEHKGLPVMLQFSPGCGVKIPRHV